MKSFFTEEDYEIFAEENRNDIKKIKFYKGLGSSTNKEGVDYFADLQTHVKPVEFDEHAAERMQLAFDPKMAASRKRWLDEGVENAAFDYKRRKMDVSQFVDNCLIHFSFDDNQRSLPNMIDGLKESQRKIVWYFLKMGAKWKPKVSQASGHVSSGTAYHHGEESLNQNIVYLAQSHVGEWVARLFLSS